MIPHPGQTLADLAMRLAVNVAPNTTDRFTEADTGLIAQLLLSLGQEFERSIATRMQDIEELKALFAKTSAGPEQSSRQAFCSDVPKSLSLSDVNALHDRGMNLLTQLHAWSEEHDEGLNRAIWTFLRRHTERHKYELP